VPDKNSKQNNLKKLPTSLLKNNKNRVDINNIAELNNIKKEISRSIKGLVENQIDPSSPPRPKPPRPGKLPPPERGYPDGKGKDKGKGSGGTGKGEDGGDEGSGGTGKGDTGKDDTGKDDKGKTTPSQTVPPVIDPEKTTPKEKDPNEKDIPVTIETTNKKETPAPTAPPPPPPPVPQVPDLPPPEPEPQDKPKSETPKLKEKPFSETLKLLNDLFKPKNVWRFIPADPELRADPGKMELFDTPGEGKYYLSTSDANDPNPIVPPPPGAGNAEDYPRPDANNSVTIDYFKDEKQGTITPLTDKPGDTEANKATAGSTLGLKGSGGGGGGGGDTGFPWMNIAPGVDYFTPQFTPDMYERFTTGKEPLVSEAEGLNAIVNDIISWFTGKKEENKPLFTPKKPEEATKVDPSSSSVEFQLPDFIKNTMDSISSAGSSIYDWLFKKSDWEQFPEPIYDEFNKEDIKKIQEQEKNKVPKIILPDGSYLPDSPFRPDMELTPDNPNLGDRPSTPVSKQNQAEVLPSDRETYTMNEGMGIMNNDYFNSTKSQPLAITSSGSNNKPTVVNNYNMMNNMSAGSSGDNGGMGIFIMSNPETTAQRVLYDVNKASLI